MRVRVKKKKKKREKGEEKLQNGNIKKKANIFTPGVVIGQGSEP